MRSRRPCRARRAPTRPRSLPRRPSAAARRRASPAWRARQQAQRAPACAATRARAPAARRRRPAWESLPRPGAAGSKAGCAASARRPGREARAQWAWLLSCAGHVVHAQLVAALAIELVARAPGGGIVLVDADDLRQSLEATEERR